MDENMKQKLFEKNQKLVDMVVERAKRDFPGDIALIGLSGSFSTGDFHEGSDLDLIIINNTDRGWGIAKCFILGDVGYDFYCSSWETRMRAASLLESDFISCLLDLKILYASTPEDLEKLKAYQQRARDILAQPMGRPCLERAKKRIDQAKTAYADLFLETEEGAARYAAGRVLYSLVNAVVQMNNTYFTRGIKRYMEMLKSCACLPENFEERYNAVIGAKGVPALRAAAKELLRSVLDLYGKLCAGLMEAPKPTYENLGGAYEELWCNYRNKLLRSTEDNDPAYAFHAALGAQAYMDEMHETRGLPKIDLMADFDAGDLKGLWRAFQDASRLYEAEYERAGRKVERYESFEELYDAYMNQR